MEIIYYVFLMYGGAFLIGFLVSVIIWLLVRIMTHERKRKSRESFQEMKQIK